MTRLCSRLEARYSSPPWRRRPANGARRVFSSPSYRVRSAAPFRFHGRSKTRHSQQQVSDICLSVRTVADNVGNPASAGLFHQETSRVDPNIGAVVYGRLDAGLGLSAASGIDLAHFQCHRLSKKRSISYPNLRVHYSLHPKKTGIPSSLVVSNGVKSAAKRGFSG